MHDTTNAQIRKPSELIKGYKEKIKNTIEKTTPKEVSDDCLLEIWLVFFRITLLIFVENIILLELNILVKFESHDSLIWAYYKSTKCIKNSEILFE